MIRMLDSEFIRKYPERVKKGIRLKGEYADIDSIVRQEATCRILLGEVEELKRHRNECGAKIARRKRQNLDTADLIHEMKTVSGEIKKRDRRIRSHNRELYRMLSRVPNLPHESVPHGRGREDNVEIVSRGAPRRADFELKEHSTVGRGLGIFDFSRGVKIAGRGFPVYRGQGAMLERACINYLLDMHQQKGYTEIIPPYLASEESLFGTGHIPRLSEKMYCLEAERLYCIPRAEVPLSNLHRDEIVHADSLPVCYCAYSPCFRREAGSWGKSTRGFCRVHQFNSVELVKLVTPERSYTEFESLRKDIESVLESLELHYRLVERCDADLSFAAAKGYRFDIWAPGTGSFLEVASCAHYEDFQSRRMNIRFRAHTGAKPRFVHTLNGSGVGTARLMAALVETYQNRDGSVTVPRALRHYTGGVDTIVSEAGKGVNEYG
jgi:seryl-tRNA synthetase